MLTKILFLSCLAIFSLESVAMGYPNFEDESERNHRMLNECMVDKLVFFLDKIYSENGAYPGPDEWAKAVNTKFLVGAKSKDCASLLTFLGNGFNDYYGKKIQYVFECPQKVIIYSENSKYLSSKSDGLMAFVLQKGKVEAKELLKNNSNYTLIDLEQGEN